MERVGSGCRAEKGVVAVVSSAQACTQEDDLSFDGSSMPTTPFHTASQLTPKHPFLGGRAGFLLFITVEKIGPCLITEG